MNKLTNLDYMCLNEALQETIDLIHEKRNYTGLGVCKTKKEYEIREAKMKYYKNKEELMYKLKAKLNEMETE